MYGFCRKENYVCLVTEFVRGGNLADCLADQEYGLDFNLQAELSLNITRGMVYLHNQGVIHRDLKPANILVSIFSFYVLISPRLNHGMKAK